MMMQLLRTCRGLAGKSAVLAVLVAAPMLSASTAYAESAATPITPSPSAISDPTPEVA